MRTSLIDGIGEVHDAGTNSIFAQVFLGHVVAVIEQGPSLLVFKYVDGREVSLLATGDGEWRIAEDHLPKA